MLSQTHLTLQEHSVSRDVPVHSQAFVGTHCAHPWRVINGVQPSELVVNIRRQLRRQQLFISVW